ncbi:DUF58 domain-containing protein [Pseudarthrobacter sp. J75]|uniref:DUF58 domain-containing protein n=1 Tax=unclassified Pseudarthrobacter TaxID=2647000 RepID=UPI002E82260F|nr:MULTISPECIES: DUF58 domain-containing protein [unclassified Pseudarthrobacter]MEE2521649.1 DUF58 domain-containing protein [Pseudarthrobacter sp. J47]MEE2527726.1 DUF58 domain-containing protein [Pseudarthrobacter sp. J75]
MRHHFFTKRGWGLLLASAVCLLAAGVMGRRDLLTLAVLLLVLPIVSLAGVRLLKPSFTVYREFTPQSVETGATTTVRLAVAKSGSGSGHTLMEERLPHRFGQSPVFRFPARSASGGTSRYEYHLRSARRGQYVIGPVTAEFTDPFGMSLHRHTIDDGDALTVTPAAVELPATGLAGARGNDGVTATRTRANPSEDDVMTREYRHGDPMRRVHWAATARHGTLMVRQEESVTTPEATIILDHRHMAFPEAPAPGMAEPDQPLSNRCFEWTVVAAMSISAHLMERNYSLRCLDPVGEAAFRRSPSAPEPEAEEFSGTAGLQSIADSLAAIGLTGHHRPAMREAAAGQEHGPAVFTDELMDKLSAHRMRGPLVALLGRISPAEARSLAAGAGYGANAFALLVTESPAECQDALEILRLGGWHATAITPSTSVQEAWSNFDADAPGGAQAPAAVDVRRGAEVAR